MMWNIVRFCIGNLEYNGVEVREGNDILFRCGVMDLGSFYQFYSEDGTLDNMLVSYETSDGMG